MKLACLGDSNTWGYDGRSYWGERFPREVRWTGRLAALPGVELVDLGENGREIPHTPYAIGRAEDELRRAAGADWLLVLLGTNDLLQDGAVTAAEAAGRMRRFLLRAAALPELSRTRTLLIAPPPLVPGAWVPPGRLTEESSRLAPAYARLASDLGASFLDCGALPLAFDGVHFIAEAHAALAEKLRLFLGL